MRRVYFKFGIDFFIWLAVTPLAYILRVTNSWQQYIFDILLVSAILIPLKLGIILYQRFSLQSWQRIGLLDLLSITKGALIYTIVFLGIAFILHGELFIPYSIPFIEAMLLVLGLGGVRLTKRLWYEYRGSKESGNSAEMRKVLIVGAGDAGTMIAREMRRHPEVGMKPVGFLDDDDEKKKMSFLGLPLLGTIEDLPEVVESHQIDELLIAMPSVSGDVVRRVVELARDAGIKNKIVPAIHKILNGNISISQIREVDLEDLLRRKPVQLEDKQISAYLESKTVLVTGAGGSIGSELVRQVMKFNPSHIVLLDHSEHNLYTFDQELQNKEFVVPYKTLITDIRDYESLEVVYKKYKPQVVLHAAAHKHVPIMEENPSQAILNNVVGTRYLVELSLEHDVEHFVNVSTDKAVNPTSVMGASKRISEYLVEWGSMEAHEWQIFVSVRFGNVLGSRGSVIPKFRKQIKNKQPVTVTHPDMTRYFMTIPEASQLVLQAGGIEQSGAVYVLDMGDPVNIMDLAEDLIRLSGFEPNVDIPIEITGMRPGEKLYEELLTAEEGTEVTRFEKIHMAKQQHLPDNFIRLLNQIIEAAKQNREEELRYLMTELIPVNQLDVNSEPYEG